MSTAFSIFSNSLPPFLSRQRVIEGYNTYWPVLCFPNSTVQGSNVEVLTYHHDPSAPSQNRSSHVPTSIASLIFVFSCVNPLLGLIIALPPVLCFLGYKLNVFPFNPVNSQDALPSLQRLLLTMNPQVRRLKIRPSLSEPGEPPGHPFSAIKAYLQDRTTLAETVDRLAAPIDNYYSRDFEGLAERSLIYTWRKFNEIIMHIPHDHPWQDRLAEILVALSKRPSPSDVKEEEVTSSEDSLKNLIWSMLPPPPLYSLEV